MHHSWSGNVREFQSALEYAVVLTKSEKVIIEDLPEDVLKEDGQHLEREENTLTKLVAEYEKEEIKKALENFNWNMQKAAQRLGLSERGLYRKIRKYALKK
ncbi:MAG: helix-turn-helix domain-containing protein [Candidatus Edwardsbacteria bacterium]